MSLILSLQLCLSLLVSLSFSNYLPTYLSIYLSNYLTISPYVSLSLSLSSFSFSFSSFLIFIVWKVWLHRRATVVSESEVSSLQSELSKERQRHLDSMQDVKKYHERSITIEGYEYYILWLFNFHIFISSDICILHLAYLIYLSYLTIFSHFFATFFYFGLSWS